MKPSRTQWQSVTYLGRSRMWCCCRRAMLRGVVGCKCAGGSHQGGARNRSAGWWLKALLRFLLLLPLPLSLHPHLVC
eukprot:scaffold48311_cov13-Tisochrysis_lutea.AAC.1